MPYKAYKAMLLKAKDHLEKGDIYQVNLSQCLMAQQTKPAYEIYQALRLANPGNHAAYLNLGEQQILSTSPERFLKVTLDGTLQTEPIKGTCPRGKTKTEDAHLKQDLLKSEKNDSELMMIVDLMRNDLGKICEYGSVTVPVLKEIRTYASVHHLVSTIQGKLKTKHLSDIIHATFPGGSITGAPKLRSMQIIEALEPHNRGIYTGSLGYMDYRGQIDLNIAIRTVMCQSQKIYVPLGGGIVIDSHPKEEFQETLFKGQKILEVLCGK